MTTAAGVSRRLWMKLRSECVCSRGLPSLVTYSCSLMMINVQTNQNRKSYFFVLQAKKSPLSHNLGKALFPESSNLDVKLLVRLGSSHVEVALSLSCSYHAFLCQIVFTFI